MSHHDVHVALCLDDGYASGAVVTARSARMALRDRGQRITFHVIDGGLTAAGRKQLLGDLAPFGEVELYSVPELVSLGYQRKWITTPAVGRLFLGRVLPDQVRRVVYLDTDTLVLEDLSALHRWELQGRGLGAVSNEAGPDRLVLLGEVAVQHEQGAKAPGYFNSGVLVADLDHWRTRQVTERALEMFHRYRSSLRSVDQDILNIVFEGAWCKLPDRWNKQIDSPRFGKFGAGRLDFLVQPEGIVHYTGQIKPWHPGFPQNALLELYEKYRSV